MISYVRYLLLSIRVNMANKKNVCNKLPSVTNVKGVVCLGLHPKILQTFKVTEYSVFGCRDLISAL